MEGYNFKEGAERSQKRLIYLPRDNSTDVLAEMENCISFELDFRESQILAGLFSFVKTPIRKYWQNMPLRISA